MVVRATEATAKTYLCEEPHSSAESASAELIVLGKALLNGNVIVYVVIALHTGLSIAIRN